MRSESSPLFALDIKGGKYTTDVISVVSTSQLCEKEQIMKRRKLGSGLRHPDRPLSDEAPPTLSRGPAHPFALIRVSEAIHPPIHLCPKIESPGDEEAKPMRKFRERSFR